MVLLRTGRYAAADYYYGDCAGSEEKEETEEEKNNKKENRKNKETGRYEFIKSYLPVSLHRIPIIISYPLFFCNLFFNRYLIYAKDL